MDREVFLLSHPDTKVIVVPETEVRGTQGCSLSESSTGPVVMKHLNGMEGGAGLRWDSISQTLSDHPKFQ